MTARTPLPAPLTGRFFTTRQALSLGVSPGRLRAADLEAPTSGVRLPVGGMLLERAAAVAHAVGPNAFVSGLTAAAVYGFPVPWRFGETIEVGVPAPSRAPRRRGVVARALRIAAGDVISYGGVRMTSPLRTFCDLGSRLTVPELVAVADRLFTSPDALHEAIAAYADGRVRPRLYAAAELRDVASESPKESETRALVCLAGLPKPTSQVDVYGDDGRFLARVDLLIEEFGEVLEYQGDHHRTDRRQWRLDRHRESALESTGLHVTEVTQHDLDHPLDFVARLAATLRRRGWTGRPRLSRWFPRA